MSKRQDDYVYEPQNSSVATAPAESSPYSVDEVAPATGRLRATSLAVSGFLIAGGIFGAAAMTNAVVENIAPQPAAAESETEVDEETEDAGFFGGVTNFFSEAFGGAGNSDESQAEATQTEESSNSSNSATNSEESTSEQTNSNSADDSNSSSSDPTAPAPSFGSSDDDDEDAHDDHGSSNDDSNDDSDDDSDSDDDEDEDDDEDDD